jgi:hypothetical protein
LKRRLGWTSQKPRRKARERNDREVARWVGDEFPRIVREAWQRSAYLAFLDESGFSLTPTVRRTLAPRGETPVLDAWDRRDRWSAISCITVSPVAGRPGLYFDLLDHNIRGPDVVAFLAELHRRLGRVTVVWDRNQIHSRAKVVKEWLAKHPGVVVEDFPGYVPDLNPDEGVWGWAKYGRLANLGTGGGRVDRGQVPARPAPRIRPPDRVARRGGRRLSRRTDWKRFETIPLATFPGPGWLRSQVGTDDLLPNARGRPEPVCGLSQPIPVVPLVPRQ